MVITVLAILLFTLVTLRFVRRAFQEGRRQQVLTWPRAVAQLEEGEDRLPGISADRFGDTTFYQAELMVPYTFYARGQRYTGNRLAPRLTQLNASEQKLLLRDLGKARKYFVYFNPDDPTENYLTIGQSLLSYGKMIGYLIYGLAVPLALLWFASDAFPEGSRWEILFVMVMGIVLAGGVVGLLAQPLFALGRLLSPAGEEIRADRDDPLLESLANRPAAIAEGEKVRPGEAHSR